MPYADHVRSHLDALADAVIDEGAPMWPSALDVRTRRMPPADHVPARVYRLIGAPRGSALYWDQPQVVAAVEFSRLFGDPRPARAVDACLRAFLDHCVDDEGVFRWANHNYFDLDERRVVPFAGGHHELRPLTPAWDLFHQLDPRTTENYLRTIADRHVYDRRTGGFNRHDDRRRDHAFIESGGVLVESLAWLYARAGDADALDLATRIAGYSFAHRGEGTGLLVNEPDHGRWDSRVATTESGLWANCLLRAGRHAESDRFDEMARAVVRAYLEYGYDAEAGRYAGQLDVATGRAVVADEPGYWPGRFADPWNTGQWPTHDYPMELAEACTACWRATGEAVFAEAIERWAGAALAAAPFAPGAPPDDWAYAESYGRCIRFLDRAGRALEAPRWRRAALETADHAVDDLFVEGMFRGASNTNLYEAVDGVGFLLLALLELEADAPLQLRALGW